MNTLTKTDRSSSVALLALLACLVLPGIASADRRSEDVLESWRGRLDRIDERLVEERWKRSHRDADELVEEMLRRLSGGEGTAVWLSRAVMRRAVAAAGLGHRDDALWDQHIASVLAPDIVSEVDLSRFGEPVRSVFAPPEEVVPGAGRPAPLTLGDDSGVVPPTALAKPMAPYPIGKRLVCGEGLVIIQAVIGVDGRVKQAQILKGDAMLAFTALDGLRDWRYEPARRDGEPVEVYYNLTINFRMPTCHGEEMPREPGQLRIPMKNSPPPPP